MSQRNAQYQVMENISFTTYVLFPLKERHIFIFLKLLLYWVVEAGAKKNHA